MEYEYIDNESSCGCKYAYTIKILTFSAEYILSNKNLKLMDQTSYIEILY